MLPNVNVSMCFAIASTLRAGNGEPSDNPQFGRSRQAAGIIAWVGGNGDRKTSPSVYLGYEKTRAPQSFWDVMIYFEIISVFCFAPEWRQPCHAMAQKKSSVRLAASISCCLRRLAKSAAITICDPGTTWQVGRRTSVTSRDVGWTTPERSGSYIKTPKKKVGIPKLKNPAYKTDLNEKTG